MFDQPYKLIAPLSKIYLLLSVMRLFRQSASGSQWHLLAAFNMLDGVLCITINKSVQKYIQLGHSNTVKRQQLTRRGTYVRTLQGYRLNLIGSLIIYFIFCSYKFDINAINNSLSHQLSNISLKIHSFIVDIKGKSS